MVGYMAEVVIQKFVPTDRDDALDNIPFTRTLLSGGQVCIVRVERNSRVKINRSISTTFRSRMEKVLRPTETKNKLQELALKENFPQLDIDHLSMLAQEESYTMPRGLTREQRRQWAIQNIQR